MKSIALKSLETHPVGWTILHNLPNLENGNYALIPEKTTGRTQILKLTPSHGTDFYKYFNTINLPFEQIKNLNLFPSYLVELNASPAGSDSQEYADALVFFV